LSKILAAILAAQADISAQDGFLVACEELGRL
jgi:hypothetical protein